MAKNLLNSVKLQRPNSSVFDLTHDFKFTTNMGELVPVLAEEAVPGDRWRISQESLVRLAALTSPMMHRCDIYFHAYFVPFRLLWDNWENFYTNKKVGGFLPAVPFFNVDAMSSSKLNDYLGLPFDVAAAVNACAFYNSAYQFIFNEYYRDQNLQPEMVYKLVDGDNGANADLFVLQQRAWEHDYFTSCLPTAQKGDAVTIPVTQNFPDVPVKRDAPGTQTTLTGVPDSVDLEYEETSSPFVDPLLMYAKTSLLNPTIASTITDLRRAFKLQEFLERENIAGNRYNEEIYAQFGVKTDDARLQRPEYITGSRSPISISEVLQTSASDDTTTPQGNMAGHGLGVSQGYGGSYFVKEPGIIMCLMSIMPKTGYFQGLPRKFSKIEDRYQYFWPLFEHIGEQEVKQKEIFANSPTPEATFGYNPRYTEYKVGFNRVGTQFKTSLKHWTMAREFAVDPLLNESFIASDPTRRVFAVTDPGVDTLYVHVLNRVTARRLMSKYSSPHL